VAVEPELVPPSVGPGDVVDVYVVAPLSADTDAEPQPTAGAIDPEANGRGDRNRGQRREAPVSNPFSTPVLGKESGHVRR